MKLAQSRFVTGARDDLAAVDVYEVNDGAVRNRASTVANNFIGGALDILRNTPGVGEALDLIADFGSLGDLSQEELQRRLDAVLGLSRSDFRGLTDDLKRQIMDQLGLESRSDSGVQAIVFGNNVNISPQRANQVQLLTNVLKNMSDDESVIELIDMAAEVALYSGIVKESIDAGIPNSLDIVKDKTSDPTVTRNIALESMASALQSGNLAAMENLMKYVSPREVTSRYPDICLRILETYRFPLGKRPEMDSEYRRIVELLDTLDSNWATEQRDGKTITRLRVFSRASRDAVELFTSGGGERPYLAEMLISRNYYRNNIPELLREQYPFAGI